MEKRSRKIVLIILLIMPLGYKVCRDIFKIGIKDGKETMAKQAVQLQK